MRIARRIRPDCEDNFVGGNFLMLAGTRRLQADRMVVDKARMCRMQINSVPQQLMADNIHFRPDDVIRPMQQVRHNDLLFYGIGCAIYVALAVSRQIKRGFAQGFARDRPLSDTDTADNGTGFRDPDALA